MKVLKIHITDFLKGILSLVISQIFIKLFGVMYTLYITNKTGFGDEGNAIYMSGYQIYALLLTISSIGVPNAISKLISEKNSIGDYTNSKRIFQISVFIFSLVGCLGCILLFAFSGFIANTILQIPESKLSLMVLSPAIFFVSITSVIRGFCNGENKIYVTAKSQFIEQVLKSLLTILFVEIVSRVTNYNTELMATVANLATTVATFCSLIYVIREYIDINRKKFNINRINFPKERIITILKRVLTISIPITTSAILSSLGKNVDSITVVRILKNIIGEEKAILKYGILSSKVDTLIALPLSFNVAISTALIPEISRKKARNDLDGIIKKINFSLLITILISLPCTLGMCFFAKPIFLLLFPRATDGYSLLALASFSIIFSLLTQTINGILLGLGNNNIPVIASIMGLIVKILSNIILIPFIFEKGAVIGNILSSLVSFIIVLIFLFKNIKLSFSLKEFIIKPILANTIMIFLSLKTFEFLNFKNINYNVTTLISIIIAVIIYIFSCFLLKIFKKSETFESVENSGLQDSKSLKNLKNK